MLEKIFLFVTMSAAAITAAVCLPVLLATEAGRQTLLVLAGWGVAVPMIGLAAGFAMWRSGWFTPAPDAPAATRTVDSTAVAVRPISPVRRAHLARMAGGDGDIYADPYHIDFRAEKQTAHRESARIAAARAYYLALEADPDYEPSYDDDDGWKDDDDPQEWGDMRPLNSQRNRATMAAAGQMRHSGPIHP